MEPAERYSYVFTRIIEFMFHSINNESNMVENVQINKSGMFSDVPYVLKESNQARQKMLRTSNAVL